MQKLCVAINVDLNYPSTFQVRLADFLFDFLQDHRGTSTKKQNASSRENRLFSQQRSLVTQIP